MVVVQRPSGLAAVLAAAVAGLGTQAAVECPVKDSLVVRAAVSMGMQAVAVAAQAALAAMLRVAQPLAGLVELAQLLLSTGHQQRAAAAAAVRGRKAMVLLPLAAALAVGLAAQQARQTPVVAAAAHRLAMVPTAGPA